MQFRRIMRFSELRIGCQPVYSIDNAAYAVYRNKQHKEKSACGFHEKTA